MLANNLVLPGALLRDLSEEWIQGLVQEHTFNVPFVREGFTRWDGSVLGNWNHVEQQSRLADRQRSVEIGTNEKKFAVKRVPTTVLD
jgi:hypothetical protein